jgi:2-dehydro-3-deoxyphosphogalactonate aldolase
VHPLLQSYLEQMPLVAILRGITFAEATDVVDVLYQAGFRIVEVPLNSPDPIRTIQHIASTFGDRMLVGAGTVLDPAEVQAVWDAGGQIIVSPNTDPDVIRASVAKNAVSLPGAATPSEVFTALKAGAHGVKAFPAEMLTPPVIKSWKSVLPTAIPVLAVGGITTANARAYWQAGVNGFGLGGSLYKAGKSIDAIGHDAAQFVSLMQNLRT